MTESWRQAAVAAIGKSCKTAFSQNKYYQTALKHSFHNVHAPTTNALQRQRLEGTQ